MTIRDNVEAVHRLLTEELHITHLRALVGFSMGAEQAFQWAVSYPDFIDRIVATSGTAKSYPHGIVRLESQIAALTAIPVFKKATTPLSGQGVEAFGMVWPVGFIRKNGGGKNYGDPTRRRHDLRAIFEKPQESSTPTPTISSCKRETWERHDVGATPGFNGDVERALRSIKYPHLLHALGNRHVLSVHRRQVRSAVHPEGNSDADSIPMGPHSGRGQQPGRCQIPKRKHSPLPPPGLKRCQREGQVPACTAQNTSSDQTG